MAPLDGAIVSVALKSIGADLHLSLGALMWVQASYLLAMAVLLIPLGRVADHHGRVRFYLLGIAVFTVGSLLAALSMSGTWLIASRVVQGTGGALLVATSAAIVTSVFPPRERGRALGINVMAVYLGLSVGPPLGGFIVDTLTWPTAAGSWRWIFVVNLPIGVILLVWGWLLLPRTEREDRQAQSPDVLGAFFLGLFLVCLLVPLTFAPEWGWLAPRSVLLLLLSAAGLLGFVLTEQRVRDPVLDLDLLRHNRLFAAANLAALLNYMALYAITILTSLFLQLVQGRTAGLTGCLILGEPVMMAALSPVSGRLSDRIGSRVLTVGGMTTVAAGMVLLATMGQAAGIARIVASLAVVGVGMAAFSAPNTSAVMGSVRRDQLSVAGAFLGTMRVSGQALSVAVLGGIAAGQLGRLGGSLLFTHGHGAVAGALTARAVNGYAQGYQYAMLTGAALALVGAAVSLTRGPHESGG